MAGRRPGVIGNVQGSDDAILQIQRFLNEVDDAGLPEDGVAGQATHSAARRFLQDGSIKGDIPQQELFRALAGLPPTQAEPQTRPDHEPDLLSIDEIRDIQAMLNDRSGLSLTVDGIVGPATLAAARVFIRLPAAGKLDATTRATLQRLIDHAPGAMAEGAADDFLLPVWIFFARDAEAEAEWVQGLVPGLTIFWIHGRAPRGGNYKLQVRAGDTVLLLVGQRLIASGVLLADDRQKFVDAQGRIRRPVRVIERYSEPIGRRALEAAAGQHLIRQGSVHPVSRAVLTALSALKSRGTHELPYQSDTFRSVLNDRPLVEDVRTAAPYILPDADTARQIGWSGLVWSPPASEDPAPVPREHRLDISEEVEVVDEAMLVDRVAEPAETFALHVTHTNQPAAAPDIDAQIPFVLDAPADSEDELDRGPFALFLAQRLHLIWCQMNGHAPDSRGGRTRPLPAESDTFIAHVDSPWGGGKTTFANFIARVLDPRQERLSARHFLRSSLAPTTPDADLTDVKLDDVFVPPFARRDPDRWRQARRPWVIARYNAWRDQYVQPPWWQVFLTIHAAVAREVRGEAVAELRRAWAEPRARSWLTGAAGLGQWCIIGLQRFGYQIWNRKLKAQVWLWLCTGGLIAGLWGFGVVEWILQASVATPVATGAEKIEAKKVSDLLTLGVAILGLGGVSIATLFTVISQSISPDLDFTAEHKQIGVQDPISRFRRAFDRILRATDRPVLLIVDDLDRCEPKTVVELLRGFQTIVRSPRLFVLLLGDRAWIENAHDVHHKDLKDLREGEEALGARFVQKMIQLSFRLPTMKPEARTRFARGVLGEGPGDPTTAKIAEVLRQVDAKVTIVVSDATSLGGKEAGVAQAVSEAKKALPAELTDGERKAAVTLVETVATGKLVAAAGADTAQQRTVFNAVTRLVDSLPNNPRQIKRIFMAFATYEVVGRAYFGYQLTAEGEDGDRKARRWRQLAMWVTLAIEWPETWRAIARRPLLLKVAYADRKTRKRDEGKLLGGLSELDRAATVAMLARLRSDRALIALLSGKPGPPTAPDLDDFAQTAMEVAAVYEFNRIIWEPGFHLEPQGAA